MANYHVSGIADLTFIILHGSIEDSSEDTDQNDEIKILRNYNFDFIRILEQPSVE